MPHCEHCGTETMDCVSRNNRPMPVNVAKMLNGNLEVVEEADGTKRALYVKPEQAVERFVCHYAVCQAAKDAHEKEKAEAKRE